MSKTSQQVERLSRQVSSLGDQIDETLLAVHSMTGPDPDGDPRTAVDDRLRELFVGLERLRNAAEAVQSGVLVAMAEEARKLDAAEYAATGQPSHSHGEFVPDEVAVLVSCTKVAAGRRYALALRAEEHADLMSAWCAGSIDGRKAQVVVDEVAVLADDEIVGILGVDAAAQLSSELIAAGVDHARTHTATETRSWLRRRVMKVSPDAVELRRGRAEHERRVEIRPADDGMSELWAWLPATEARQIQQALTSAAHDLGAQDVRTMDQRRADLLVDWLLGPDHAPVVNLHLVAETDVADDTALDTAAWLPGVGPLTELQTADLIGSAAKVVTVLPVAPVIEPRYRPTAGLERTVRARDVICRFPGCSRAGLGTGTGTDLDHTAPWPVGVTALGNLAVLCRRHHRLKHSPGWGVVMTPDGVMTWTAPSGRTFTSEPWRPPRGSPVT